MHLLVRPILCVRNLFPKLTIFLGNPNTTTSIVNLENHHALRQLTFLITASFPFYCNWVRGTLSSITSSHFSVVTIQLIFTRESLTSFLRQFGQNDWISFEKILMDVLDLGLVKKFVIRLCGGPPTSDRDLAMEEINLALARLFAKGSGFVELSWASI